MPKHHPARNARQIVGTASVAAFIGAAIAVGANGHNGASASVGAAATATKPSGNVATLGSNRDDGSWSATTPNGDDSTALTSPDTTPANPGTSGSNNTTPQTPATTPQYTPPQDFGGGNGSFANQPSHSSSGGS